MDQRGKTGHGWIPWMTVAVIGLSFTAGPVAANPETVPVRVTFVDPIAINQLNALEFGSLDQNLASSETVTVAPDSTVADPADRVEAGPQAAASLAVTATPGRAITIEVNSVDPGTGYSLDNFQCNYNSGTDADCDGSGYSETSAASGTLNVGATLTGDGTAVAGPADGSFDVTVTYQ